MTAKLRHLPMNTKNLPDNFIYCQFFCLINDDMSSVQRQDFVWFKTIITQGFCPYLQVVRPYP